MTVHGPSCSVWCTILRSIPISLDSRSIPQIAIIKSVSNYIAEYPQVANILNISKLHVENMKNVETVHFMAIFNYFYIYSKNNEASLRKCRKKSNLMRGSPHLLEGLSYCCYSPHQLKKPQHNYSEPIHNQCPIEVCSL